MNAIAVLCCALGMGTKEVLVTAPVVALLYDRTFLAGSFRQALRLRRWLYAGLAGTWLIGAYVVFGERRSPTIGFHIGISPLQYARTELNVIAHYVLLTFWPRHLALDYYDWPVARSWADIGWGGWLVILLGIAVIVALWRRPRLGFLGAWVFVILSPSSSFVPLPSEIAAERRMYLPLMSITALIVVGGWMILRRHRLGRIAAITATCTVVCVLGTLTRQRNRLYANAIDIMADAVEARPNNPRALFDYGNALSDAGYAQPEGSPAAVACAARPSAPSADRSRRSRIITWPGTIWASRCWRPRTGPPHSISTPTRSRPTHPSRPKHIYSAANSRRPQRPRRRHCRFPQLHRAATPTTPAPTISSPSPWN